MTAAHGKVIIHESKMLRTTGKFVCRVVNPMPSNAPHEICVVETGSPNRLAATTNKLVARLAENP